MNNFDEAQDICTRLGLNLASLDSNPFYNYMPKNLYPLVLEKGSSCDLVITSLYYFNFEPNKSGISNYSAWTSIRRSVAASNTLFWMSGVKPPMFIGNYDNNNYNCGVVYPISNPNYMLNCSTTNAFVLCDNSTIS